MLKLISNIISIVTSIMNKLNLPTFLGLIILVVLFNGLFIGNLQNDIIQNKHESIRTITLNNQIQYSADQEDNKSSKLYNDRLQHFADGKVFSYLWSLVKPYFKYSRMSYLAASLIFLIYLFYFRYIDIYEYEPWKYIISTFFAGVIFADLGLIFYDFTSVIVGWRLNDGLINDFFYTIIVIGGIEEFVKILPLILLLRFTKIVNEPVDYIVYGGVAALGFAFAENVMYFDRLGASVILGRALTAVVLHTSLTGIVAYGFVLRDYRKKSMAPFRMFLVAIILHGLYDLFLINPTAQSFMLIAYVILFASISTFNNILSNSLSNSPYYSASVHLEIRKIQFLLVGGLLGIFILQFILLITTESLEAAKDNILSSSIAAVILIPALVVGFGKIKLHPRKWKSLKIPFLITKITIDNEGQDIKGKYLQFKNMTRNALMLDYFPNMGKVYKQSSDSKGRLWFYIQLERIAHHPNYNNKHIVIRSKFGNELLNESKGIGMAGIYLINNKTKKPKFVGWCSVEIMISSKVASWFAEA